MPSKLIDLTMRKEAKNVKALFPLTDIAIEKKKFFKQEANTLITDPSEKAGISTTVESTAEVVSIAIETRGVIPENLSEKPILLDVA